MGNGSAPGYPTQPIAPAVAFNYDNWVAQFPEFQYITQPMAQAYFNWATLYCQNTLRFVCDPNTLTMLLNMLTAHLAKLFAPLPTGQNSSDAVGRIASAGEGSVNVSLDYNAPQAASWYLQSRYGAAFWEATKAYRTARYLRPQIRNMNPWFWPQ
jgi:hypothetical protein